MLSSFQPKFIIREFERNEEERKPQRNVVVLPDTRGNSSYQREISSQITLNLLRTATGKIRYERGNCSLHPLLKVTELNRIS